MMMSEDPDESLCHQVNGRHERIERQKDEDHEVVISQWLDSRPRLTSIVPIIRMLPLTGISVSATSANSRHHLLLTFLLLISGSWSVHAFMQGPACRVTTMIPGSPNPATTSMEGSCQSILQCRGIGGVPIGKCGLANVCCVCESCFVLSCV